MNTKIKQYLKKQIQETGIIQDLEKVKSETICNVVLRNELSPADKSIFLLCMFVENLINESHEDTI